MHVAKNPAVPCMSTATVWCLPKHDQLQHRGKKRCDCTFLHKYQYSFVQVLDWLEDELELGEYRREFARAKVDGALLLNLEVCDISLDN